MKCPKCQFENPDDTRFFIECGPDFRASKEILQLISKNLNPVEMDYWPNRTNVAYVKMHTKKGDKSKAKENLNKTIAILSHVT